MAFAKQRKQQHWQAAPTTAVGTTTTVVGGTIWQGLEVDIKLRQVQRSGFIR
jgi:hypothetical protein